MASSYLGFVWKGLPCSFKGLVAVFRELGRTCVICCSELACLGNPGRGYTPLYPSKQCFCCGKRIRTPPADPFTSCPTAVVTLIYRLVLLPIPRSPLGVLCRRFTSRSSWAGMAPSECTEASRRTRRRPSFGRRGRRRRAARAGRRTSWSTAGTGSCSTRTGRWAHHITSRACPRCLLAFLVARLPGCLVTYSSDCVLTYSPNLVCGICERNAKEIKGWRMHCCFSTGSCRYF